MGTYCFGIDVGGTTVKCGLFRTDGTLVEKWEIPTRKENNGDQILPDVAAAVNAKMEEKGISKEEVEGVGIGVPGPVNSKGEVSRAVNLFWGYKNVVGEMEELTGLHAEAGNDANVAALGEAWKGAAAGSSDVIMVTLGTGVGGGVIIGNNILTGYNGGAGEIGHFHMNDEETDVCGCGKKGCLEQYASATGVVRLAKRYMADNDDTKMKEFGDNITAKDVFDLAKEGDQGANVVVKQMGTYLGRAMGFIAATVNPQAFIIGGGVSKAGQFLIDAITDTYRNVSFKACSEAAVCLAELGNDAGMYGAAALVK
jgi:glucokinase